MEKLLNKEILGQIVKQAPINSVTEIRLRLNRKIYIKTMESGFFIENIATDKIINTIIMIATNYSQYAYEKEISDGYLPYKNGIRIGIGGNGRINERNLIAYKEIYSINIRVPHQIFNCCRPFFDILDNFDSTLVISPPYGGKTTLIREMSRLLSENFDTLIIDERYELCGENCTLKMGERCDIVQGIPKKLVFENIIRTMSPEIVVCDELFGESDYNAVVRIINSGIKCLATFHAKSVKDLPPILKKHFFYIITLNSKPKVGSIISIYRGKND